MSSEDPNVDEEMRKQAEEEAAKKLAEEEAAKKLAEEEAAKKLAEEEAAIIPPRPDFHHPFGRRSSQH